MRQSCGFSGFRTSGFAFLGLRTHPLGPWPAVHIPQACEPQHPTLPQSPAAPEAPEFGMRAWIGFPRAGRHGPPSSTVGFRGFASSSHRSIKALKIPPKPPKAPSAALQYIALPAGQSQQDGAWRLWFDESVHVKWHLCGVSQHKAVCELASGFARESTCQRARRDLMQPALQTHAFRGKASTLNPQPSTLNPKPQTLNPKP